MLLTFRYALALDPNLDVCQYAHTSWKIRDGFAKGQIHSIAQALDGYLWLGTELACFASNGVRTVPWQPQGGEQLPSNFISGLLVASDGTLWIGTMKGLASWQDGKLTQHPEVAGALIGLFLEDREQIRARPPRRPLGITLLQSVPEETTPGAHPIQWVEQHSEGNASIRQPVSYHVAVLTIALCRSCELLPCGQQGGNS
jgi:hypothetical protein